MKVRLALLLALALTGCASAPSGIQFAPGELQACAATKRCMVMTPEQLRRFYGMAFQAGRAFEQGVQQGEQNRQDENAPWQEEGFFQREL